MNNQFINLGSPINELFPPLPNYETLYEGGFTWHIDNWETLEKNAKDPINKKVESPVFNIHNDLDNDFDWKLLLYPLGNNNPKCVAVYLNPTPKDKQLESWNCCVQFSIFFQDLIRMLFMLGKSHITDFPKWMLIGGFQT